VASAHRSNVGGLSRCGHGPTRASPTRRASPACSPIRYRPRNPATQSRLTRIRLGRNGCRSQHPSELPLRLMCLRRHWHRHIRREPDPETPPARTPASPLRRFPRNRDLSKSAVAR
jgi:hypothetical protein